MGRIVTFLRRVRYKLVQFVWLQKTKGIPSSDRDTGSAYADIATLEDLHHCYRLFLHRAPDPEGWVYWKRQLEQQQYPLARLTEGFLNSAEFRSQQQVLHAPVMVELEGFRMFVRRDDWTIGKAIATQKIWEPHVTQEIRQLLKPGVTFVDIGANIGYFSLFAAPLVGETGRIIAIEPNPENCDLILQSIRINGFQNIHVCPYAVAEKEQEFVLGVDGSNSGIFEIKHRREHSGPVVQAKTLDDLLKDESRIDLIKIDIEGAEARALQGMSQILRRYRPVIFTEFFPFLLERHSGVTPQEYLNQLRQFGYAFFILYSDGRKSAGSQSVEQIVTLWRQMGNPNDAYLDLIALPVSHWKGSDG